MKSSLAILAVTTLALPLAIRADSFDQSYSIGLAIPDDSSSGRVDVRTVSLTQATISSISVTLEIDPAPGKSAFLGDLYAYLEHDGVMSVLLNRPGRRTGESAGFDDDQSLNVTFADGAPDIHDYRVSVSTPLSGPLTGTFAPDGRATDPGGVLTSDTPTLTLGGFVGHDGTGDWRLFVADLSGGAEHQLISWRLQLLTADVPEPQVWWSAGILAIWACARLLQPGCARTGTTANRH